MEERLNYLKSIFGFDYIFEITEEKYNTILSILPPIYFDNINGVEKKGFAISEVSFHNNLGVC